MPAFAPPSRLRTLSPALAVVVALCVCLCSAVTVAGSGDGTDVDDTPVAPFRLHVLPRTPPEAAELPDPLDLFELCSFTGGALSATDNDDGICGGKEKVTLRSANGETSYFDLLYSSFDPFQVVLLGQCQLNAPQGSDSSATAVHFTLSSDLLLELSTSGDLVGCATSINLRDPSVFETYCTETARQLSILRDAHDQLSDNCSSLAAQVNALQGACSASSSEASEALLEQQKALCSRQLQSAVDEARSEVEKIGQEKTLLQEQCRLLSQEAKTACDVEIATKQGALDAASEALQTALADLTAARAASAVAEEKISACLAAAAAAAADVKECEACKTCEDCGPLRAALEEHRSAAQASGAAQEAWRVAHEDVQQREKDCQAAFAAAKAAHTHELATQAAEARAQQENALAAAATQHSEAIAAVEARAAKERSAAADGHAKELEACEGKAAAAAAAEAEALSTAAEETSRLTGLLHETEKAATACTASLEEAKGASQQAQVGWAYR